MNDDVSEALLRTRAKSWNESDTNDLLVMYSQNKSITEIARVLKRSETSVVNKLYRLRQEKKKEK